MCVRIMRQAELLWSCVWLGAASEFRRSPFLAQNCHGCEQHGYPREQHSWIPAFLEAGAQHWWAAAGMHGQSTGHDAEQVAFPTVLPPAVPPPTTLPPMPPPPVALPPPAGIPPLAPLKQLLPITAAMVPELGPGPTEPPAPPKRVPPPPPPPTTTTTTTTSIAYLVGHIFASKEKSGIWQLVNLTSADGNGTFEGDVLKNVSTFEAPIITDHKTGLRGVPKALRPTPIPPYHSQQWSELYIPEGQQGDFEDGWKKGLVPNATVLANGTVAEVWINRLVNITEKITTYGSAPGPAPAAATTFTRVVGNKTVQEQVFVNLTTPFVYEMSPGPWPVSWRWRSKADVIAEREQWAREEAARRANQSQAPAPAPGPVSEAIRSPAAAKVLVPARATIVVDAYRAPVAAVPWSPIADGGFKPHVTNVDVVVPSVAAVPHVVIEPSAPAPLAPPRAIISTRSNTFEVNGTRGNITTAGRVKNKPAGTQEDSILTGPMPRRADWSLRQAQHL